jgi:RNA polymerase sigma-70 factor (ECF subfamily)
MTEFQPHSTELVQQLTKCQNSIYAYILSLIPNREIAQEILQETNLVICKKAAEFQKETNFLGWAFAIARFEVLAHRRRTGREKLTFGDGLLERLASADPQQFDVEERILALGRCLDKLPARQRALIEERYQPTVTMESLAKRIGRAKQSLAVTLHRIRQTLLQCLENADHSGRLK